MRQRVVCGAIAATLLAVMAVQGDPARASQSATISRVSGPSPFPSAGCGQLDQRLYGSQHGGEFDMSLVANPQNAAHLVAAWIQDEGFGIVTATSFDGGASWTRAVVPGVTICSGGKAQRVLHARLAFGPGGHVWVAGEVLEGYFPDLRSGINGVVVAASHDGGLTWARAARVETRPAMNGLNHIAADPSSPGAVVAVWHSPEPVARSFVSRSDDGGATWTARRVPSYAPDSLPFHRLVIAPNGTYHLFTAEATLRTFATGSARKLTVRRSTDRGATWSASTTIAAGVPWQWPSAAVGPDGTLYAQWLRTAGNTKDLLVARSSNGGNSWSTPVVAATALVGPEPGFAVTPAGVLASAHTTGDASTRVLRLARSVDGGATWTTTTVDGPYAKPANEGYFNDTAATTDGAIAAVYTRTGADTDGPTDVHVAVVR